MIVNMCVQIISDEDKIDWIRDVTVVTHVLTFPGIHANDNARITTQAAAFRAKRHQPGYAREMFSSACMHCGRMS